MHITSSTFCSFWTWAKSINSLKNKTQTIWNVPGGRVNEADSSHWVLADCLSHDAELVDFGGKIKVRRAAVHSLSITVKALITFRARRSCYQINQVWNPITQCANIYNESCYMNLIRRLFILQHTSFYSHMLSGELLLIHLTLVRKML